MIWNQLLNKTLINKNIESTDQSNTFINFCKSFNLSAAFCDPKNTHPSQAAQLNVKLAK